MTILRKYFDFKEIKQHSIINKLSNIYSISEGASQVPNYKTNLEKTGIKYSFFLHGTTCSKIFQKQTLEIITEIFTGSTIHR